MVVGFCWILLFLFVPETFWERTPHAHHSRHGSKRSSVSGFSIFRRRVSTLPSKDIPSQLDGSQSPATTEESTPRKLSKHVGFAASTTDDHAVEPSTAELSTAPISTPPHETSQATESNEKGKKYQPNFKV